MARLKKNIGELVSGKVGNLVFYQLNGESYVRAAPVRKKNSWTPEQLMHRQRFGMVSNLWKQFKSAQLTPIWNMGAQKMNGYAQFMKANMPAFAMDGSLIDPKMLQLSLGTLHLPVQLKAERIAAEPSTIAVSWQNDLHLKGERLTDELMAVSYADGKYSHVTASGIVRGAMNGSFALPQHPTAATHIYLFFASGDEKDYTGSVCFEV